MQNHITHSIVYNKTTLQVSMCAFAMFLKYLVVKLIRNMHDLDVTSVMQTDSLILGDV